MERKCKQCNSNFECNINNKDYCSIKCQKANLSYYNKIKYQNNKLEIKSKYIKSKKRYTFRCIVCNKSTSSKVKHTLSCVKCRKEYYNIKKKETHQYNYSNNINYRLACNIRSRFKGALKKYINIGYTGKDIFDLCDCSLSYLIKHLEKQFVDNMSWTNYGSWHIDHIKPICEFDLRDKKQIKLCFHYSNLQPLWAMDNYKKGKISLVKVSKPYTNN